MKINGVSLNTRPPKMKKIEKLPSMNRGICYVCGFSQRLRKDGITIQKHQVFSGNTGRKCNGSGMALDLFAVRR
jgi:hypothetical protein